MSTPVVRYCAALVGGGGVVVGDALAAVVEVLGFDLAGDGDGGAGEGRGAGGGGVIRRR